MRSATLKLDINDAMVVRDALIEAYLALRTGVNGVLISEETFLEHPNSDARKQRYLVLHELADQLKDFITKY